MKSREEKTPFTLYGELAKKYGVTIGYVGKIVRGERIPKRAKTAKQILDDFKQVSNLLNIES